MQTHTWFSPILQLKTFLLMLTFLKSTTDIGRRSREIGVSPIIRQNFRKIFSMIRTGNLLEWGPLRTVF